MFTVALLRRQGVKPYEKRQPAGRADDLCERKRGTMRHRLQGGCGEPCLASVSDVLTSSAITENFRL